MRYLLLFISSVVFISCNGNKDVHHDEQLSVQSSQREALFKANCASCHKPDKDFTGPALKGSLDRWPDKGLLFDFVRNPSQVIYKSTYAKALLDKFQSTMTPFPQLTDAEIKSILDYCDAYDPEKEKKPVD